MWKQSIQDLEIKLRKTKDCSRTSTDCTTAFPVLSLTFLATSSQNYVLFLIVSIDNLFSPMTIQRTVVL